ncbi:MAG: hypothetical protein ACT4OV_00625 [Microthrixaceae bacterium]
MALVLVATVLLVLGLLSDDGLTLIYLSIASSVAAAAVLVVALRTSKPRTSGVHAAAPNALPEVEHEPELAIAGSTAGDLVEVAPTSAPASTDEWLASDLADWSGSEAADDVDDPDDLDDREDLDAEEVEFPIADYDTLSVGQILPLLPQLYDDEIDVVEERERLTKARPQVLAKLAELRDAPSVSDPLASYTEPAGELEAWDDDEDWFPIEDYESLSAAQILPLLPELDEEELQMVRTRELSLGRRRSLLDEIDRALGVTPPPAAPSEPAVPPKKAPPVKKAAAPVRKGVAPTKKVTAAAPVKKAAAPARKPAAAAKKPAAAASNATPVKKAAAPAKSAVAPAKSAVAPVKKVAAAAKKAAAPVKKAPAPVKKAAAPVKKAAASSTNAAKAAGTKTTPAKKSARS